MRFSKTGCLSALLTTLGLSLFLCGCSSSPRVDMLKGRFDVVSYADFKGVGRELPQDTDFVGISISGNIAQRTEIPMDVSDEYFDDVEARNHKVDFAYVVQKLQAYFLLDRVYKATSLVSGYSIGLGTQPSLMTRFFVGLNKKNFELGVFSSLEFAKLEGDYYASKYSSYCNKNYCFDEMSKHTFFSEGVGGYASVILDQLALTATVSAYNYWLNEEDDMHLSFDMPYLYSIYGGASYWITQHFKFSLGVTGIMNAERRTISLNGSLGYWR